MKGVNILEVLGLNIWFILLVVFVILEAATIALVSVWFCIGSVVAWLISLAGASLSAQIIIFLVVSLICLIFLRPLVSKYVKKDEESKTNIDALIGQKAIVTEKIDNLRGSGELKINGQLWSAKNLKDEIIEKGNIVIIRKVQGAKLFVERVEE